MDVDDDNAQARGLKEMNDLMEGINNHYGNDYSSTGL